MRELSLFTGAGGGIYGSKLLGWETVGYVEYDKFCCRVIEQRIMDGIFDDAPVFEGDIREFIARGYAAAYTGMVDVLTAGFPCQPFSVAGKQAGADDERNMWPATIECIRMVRPRHCLLENVPGLITSGYFGTILGDLAAAGYDARWAVISAADCGAPHRRERLWIYCSNADGYGLHEGKIYQRANPWLHLREHNKLSELLEPEAFWAKTDTCINGSVDGVAYWFNRLRATGNGQVPAVVALAWSSLTNA